MTEATASSASQPGYATDEKGEGSGMVIDTEGKSTDQSKAAIGKAFRVLGCIHWRINYKTKETTQNNFCSHLDISISLYLYLSLHHMWWFQLSYKVLSLAHLSS